MTVAADNLLEFTQITDSFITQDFTTAQDYLFAANTTLRFIVNSNSSSPSSEEIRFLDGSTVRLKFHSNNMQVEGQVRLNAGKKLAFNSSMTTAVYRDSSAQKLRFVANGTEVMTVENSTADNAIELKTKVVFHKRVESNVANYGLTIPTYTGSGTPSGTYETGDILIQSHSDGSVYRVWGFFGDSGGGWYYADLVAP